MGINVMDTEVGVKLRKTRLLLDAVAWYDSVDANVKSLILTMIQNDQLRQRGVDEFGEVIGYYSRLTESISGGKKKFNTHYTMEDTGEFFKQMFVITMRDSLVIDSDGAEKKEDNLFDKYGTKIIGLTNENTEKLIVVLRAKYIKYARKVLELN